MHARVNEVKRREMFRPLAPSVMAEEVAGWFDGVPPLDSSPYMSITASVRAERREDVPAITHVDGSARLQSVAAADAPLYYALIAAFFLATGCPSCSTPPSTWRALPSSRRPSTPCAASSTRPQT